VIGAVKHRDVVLILDLEFVALKRYPADLNRRDSQTIMNERVFVH
jgi:hypothetical protein